MTTTTNPPPARLGSLDAFRGATIAAMLLVNNPGSWSAIYPPLAHAPWHGWTFTDLIFPAFLWIVGVAITLSFAKRQEQGADRGELFRHVLRRSAIIFALGLFLAAFPFGLLPAHEFSLARLRIPGVLQRIAVGYLVASAIFLRTSWRGQLAWALALLTGHALALKFIPVPGFGAGVLEPKGNLAWWIDSHLLAGHTWRGAPTPGFDPEGILSTVPAISTVLLGVLAGHWLRRASSGAKIAGGLIGGGLVLLIVGAALGLWLPINKNLWTSSYAVFTAGWAQLLFGLFYWAMDVRGWKGWAAPFTWFGVNALALFVLSGLIARLLGLIQWIGADGTTKVTAKGWIYAHGFTPYFSPVNASLAFAICFVLLHLALAWWLCRRHYLFKV
ncbi:acyltransferase family protein [Oleiharenicola lentus]|uniref:acyltransferase family protein n=1 Tax=Oleiharenicola lentus TaxID=2508720 RepID=UPI003F67CC11